MNRDIIKFAILFIILVLTQVLIFNHIILFDYAIPFVFIYLIVALPIGMNKNWLLTISFLLGLSVDFFSDTLGMNALACTILAITKTPVFYSYVDKDDKTRYIFPSVNSIGWGTYSKFLLTLTAIFCMVVFTIEYLSIADFIDIVLLTVASTLLTFFLLMACDCLTMVSKRV